ncbi:MAG TPA: tyrosine--tRNA ligase [Bacteroides sp.]|nr:tyrosine--tRNA ligase [Bacteroides sp.]
MNFVEELQWRGMIHDIMPGTEEQLEKEMTTAYIGFDPTSDSLHIGSLVQIIILRHFQLAGHRPLVLVGGATGMIGDPSGRSSERNLLDESTLRKNQDGIRNQLAKFLDFSEELPNGAKMVNNYDWMKEYSFLDFIRDIGKHLTVNYMMAKDSVKKRISQESKEGMSFTEFTYQLVQGYDFLHLYESMDCKLQMGGSDQWGNIVTGTELIRRKKSGEAFALTVPLVTKADGGKFGKTEEGNVWLDPRYTSPYKFYQFWINVSDEDAEKYIKTFTFLNKNEIDNITRDHVKAPHERMLQKTLAREVTTLVHSKEDYEAAVEASQILFGKSTKESLQTIREDMFLSVFEGVPQFSIGKDKKNSSVMDLLSVHTAIFSSKGELKRMVQGGGLMINKQKVEDTETQIDQNDFINGKYLLVQKGKKNYYLITLQN